MKTEDFAYDLPPHLIAQNPAHQRRMSRLMVLDPSRQIIRHDRFDRIGAYLAAGDVLVANRTRVVPARLLARRPTGGAVELLLLQAQGPGTWRALVRPSRKMHPGTRLQFDESSLVAMMEERVGDGEWTVRFSGVEDVDAEARRLGHLPLPPYIRASTAPEDRYQTVYADREGSIAAPTAGLHFDDALLDSLRSAGVGVEFITLHVGVGTFKPITSEVVEEHRMHAEWGEVPADVASRINAHRDRGGRVIAVGTTTTRLLESASDGGRIGAFCGETDRFIYPGYQFTAIHGLVTNFHLPRSTLLMLVSALAGREFIRAAYAEAVREEYRFFSFGDAMLIL